MRLGHDQTPAVRADPLEITGDVAHLVLPVLQRACLVAEHQSAEKHLSNRVSREHQADVTLRAAELVEALQVALGLHPAVEGRVGDIGKVALGLGPDLDQAAAVKAVGDRRRSDGGVRVEQGALAGDFIGMSRLLRGIERVDERLAPVGEPRGGRPSVATSFHAVVQRAINPDGCSMTLHDEQARARMTAAISRIS